MRGRIVYTCLASFVLAITATQVVRAQQVGHYILDKMMAKEMAKGITLRTASGVNGTFGQFTMKKDAFVPMHSHENEQYSFILKGSVQATIGDTIIIVKAGEAVVIPPHVPHSFKSLAEGTIDLDFFAPISFKIAQDQGFQNWLAQNSLIRLCPGQCVSPPLTLPVTGYSRLTWMQFFSWLAKLVSPIVAFPSKRAVILYCKPIAFSCPGSNGL